MSAMRRGDAPAFFRFPDVTVQIVSSAMPAACKVPEIFAETTALKEENLCLVNQYAMLNCSKLCNYYETSV